MAFPIRWCLPAIFITATVIVIRGIYGRVLCWKSAARFWNTVSRWLGGGGKLENSRTISRLWMGFGTLTSRSTRSSSLLTHSNERALDILSSCWGVDARRLCEKGSFSDSCNHVQLTAWSEVRVTGRWYISKLSWTVVNPPANFCQIN